MIRAAVTFVVVATLTVATFTVATSRGFAQSPSDPAAKIRAADAAGDRGAKGKDAVADLTTMLKDSDATVRWHAARALGAIGPDAAPAIGGLSTSLGDSDVKVRAYSAFALGRIGEAAKPAVPQLVVAVKDTDASVRREALKALGQIRAGPTVVVPLVIEILKSAQPDEVVAILHSMAAFGEQVVPGLNEALKHENARYWACLVIAELGPKAAATVPGLTDALGDDDAEVRREAAIALGHIGPAAAPAVPAIVKLVPDKGHGVRGAAMWSLGMIGPAANSAMPVVQANLNDSDVMFRAVTSWTAAKLDPTNDGYRRQALARLLEAAKDPKPRVRGAALMGLADLKAWDATTIPMFIAALTDADHSVAGIAANALVDAGPAAVAPLTAALANDTQRGYAVAELGRLGPAAQVRCRRCSKRSRTRTPRFRPRC